MSQDSQKKHFMRGGQIEFFNFWTRLQINKSLFGIFCVGWTICFAVCAYLLISKDVLMHVFYYELARLFKLVGLKHVFLLPYSGGVYKQTVVQLITHPYYPKAFDLCVSKLMQSAFMATCFSLMGVVILSLKFIKKGKENTENQFIRGSSLISPKELQKLITKDNRKSDLHIDNLHLVKNTEAQHFLVHGTIGMGKSQLIMKLLDQLRARGDRVIIYDKGCSFVSRYFDEEQDVLLNPYDKRCANWQTWLEARDDAGLENQAESLIPIEGESQPFFIHAARSVYSATASKMRHDPDCSHKKLLQFLLTGEFKQMEPYLAGTPAATLMSDKVEKMAISVRAMITTYVKSLLPLVGIEESGKKPFCIRDYILDEKTNGWLFISSNGEKHNSLKPLMSMWLSMASLSLLSLPENLDRRIWFICDELPSLHQLPFLRPTIAESRKFGGCFVLGMQNFFQLAQVYGQNGARDLFDLLNTRFYFRSPSSEMAKLVSDELCNEEVEEVKESTSIGTNANRDGVSLSSHRVTRPVVEASEIMRLKELSCYARFPGYPITKLDLKLEKRGQKTQGFIEREIPVYEQKLQNPILSEQESLNFISDNQILPESLVEKRKFDVDLFI